VTIEAIRDRLDRALPGPWRPGKAGNSVVTDGTNGGDPSTDDWYGGRVVCESSPWATVEFIAHSRGDIECLLAVAEAARPLLNRYAELVEGGDCGYWDPHSEPEFARLRETLDAMDASS
jgi:hypothetical protein